LFSANIWTDFCNKENYRKKTINRKEVEKLGKQNNPRLRVILIIGEIIKIATEFKIPVSALVTKGENAVKGLMVQFYLGTEKSGAAIETDNNGRVVYEFSGIPLTEKVVMLQVQVNGTSAWARENVALPAEQKLPTRTLTYSNPAVFGDNGIYTIQVKVTDERYNGIEGQKFIFRDKFSPNDAMERSTGPNGLCRVSVRFQDIYKHIVVDYPNGTSQEVRLFGPIPSRLVHIKP
jgi:hypothetical protein